MLSAKGLERFCGSAKPGDFRMENARRKYADRLDPLFDSAALCDTSSARLFFQRCLVAGLFDRR